MHQRHRGPRCYAGLLLSSVHLLNKIGTINRYGGHRSVEFDRVRADAEARRYLLERVHIRKADLKLEGTANVFGEQFVLFSFEIASCGALWLVRGPQGYGLYRKTELPEIEDVILHHFDNTDAELESELAASFASHPVDEEQ